MTATHHNFCAGLSGLLPRQAAVIVFALAVNIRAAEPPEKSGAPRQDRPATWATAVTVKGLPNLFKVSDSLYRCAQPEKEGFKQLQALGIRTVVSLREFHDDAKYLKNTGIGYEWIKSTAGHPEEEDVVRFLQIATDTNRTPVLVHCLHGADRTGTMCAIYRIVVQGWTKEQAIKEMTDGGYGFHSVYENLIKYIQELDTDKLKKKIAGKQQAHHESTYSSRISRCRPQTCGTGA